ncbi:retrovirus polyprotein [Apiospora saccharicola]|uniref:Retrovirus polyprotein n=1 Tax=Apiospora saccharicola TaxID=335842 RepID=A0ABR1UGR7_9PEZI
MAAKPSPKHMKRSDTQSPLPAIQKRIRELEDSKSEDEDSHSEDEDSAVEDEDGSRLPYRRSPIEAVPTQKGGLSPDSDLRKMDRSLLDNRDADIDEPVLEEPDYRYHNLDVYPERDEQGSYRDDGTTDVAAFAPVCLLEDNDDAPAESGVLLTDALLDANRKDDDLATYRARARNQDKDFHMSNGLLLFQSRLVVPGVFVIRLIHEMHARITSAHPGRNKTRMLIAAQYWWPRMNGDIDRYLANYMTCKASKHPRDKTPGLLKPLPVPYRAWHSLAVDFKSMPKDKQGRDDVLVVIDRLSKAVWSTACTISATAGDAARMYYEGPFRIFGLPKNITSDRGPQFVTDFTNEMSRILGIKWKLATSGHSQTAGQAEIINEYLDQRLRPYVNHFQDNWAVALPAMDAVQLSMPHESLFEPKVSCGASGPGTHA